MIQFNDVDAVLQLNEPNEVAYLEGLILWFNDFLKVNYQLEFNDEGLIETRTFKHTDGSTSLIPTGYVRDITAVKIVNTMTGDEQDLVEGDDYITYRHRLDPNPVFEFRLSQFSIQEPTNLQVTGDFTFGDNTPDSILNGLIEMAQLGLGNLRFNKGLMQNSGQVKKSTEIGDVRVRFSDVADRVVAYDAIIRNSNLLNVLSIYKV
jgi:hypothetical protein